MNVAGVNIPIGARKASDIVMFTLRTLHLSRLAMLPAYSRVGTYTASE
jgi:hypothetical protein